MISELKFNVCLYSKTMFFTVQKIILDSNLIKFDVDVVLSCSKPESFFWSHVAGETLLTKPLADANVGAPSFIALS